MAEETKAGDVIFAFGRKYKLTKPVEFVKENNAYYATGYRFIKSKQQFSTVSLISYIGSHYEVVKS